MIKADVVAKLILFKQENINCIFIFMHMILPLLEQKKFDWVTSVYYYFLPFEKYWFNSHTENFFDFFKRNVLNRTKQLANSNFSRHSHKYISLEPLITRVCKRHRADHHHPIIPICNHTRKKRLRRRGLLRARGRAHNSRDSSASKATHKIGVR